MDKPGPIRVQYISQPYCIRFARENQVPGIAMPKNRRIQWRENEMPSVPMVGMLSKCT